MSDERVNNGEKSQRNRPKESNENGSLEEQPSSSYHTALEELSESGESDLQLTEPSKYAFSSYKFDKDQKRESEVSEEDKLKKGVTSQRSLHDIQLAKSQSPAKIIVKDVVDKLSLPSQTNLNKVQPSQVRFSLTDEPQAKLVDAPRTAVQPLPSKPPTAADGKKSPQTTPILKGDRKRDPGTPSTFSTNLEKGQAFVYMVLPPDGGYAWCIVLLTFLIQLIIDGIILSLGITLPHMAKDLEVGPRQIIFVSALQISFYFLAGPIVSAVINKYGFRKVSMSGAAASIVFFIISSISPNLTMLIIFYSVLAGPSLSMIYCSSQLIVGYYFEKYRPIATGLSCSGAGVGLFVFIELNSRFVTEFGWRNNTILQSGFIGIAMLLCIGLKEVKPSKIGIIREDKDFDFSSNSSKEEIEVKTFTYANPMSIKSEDRGNFLKIKKITESRMVRQERTSCVGTLRKCCKRRTSQERDIEDKSFHDNKHYVIKKDIINKKDLYYTGPADYSEHGKQSKRELISGKDVELIDDERPIAAINYTFSMHGLQREKEEEKPRTSNKRWQCSRLARIFPKKIKHAFKILFKVQLFRVMEFQLFFAAAFTYAFGLNTPFLFSKERAELPEHQKYMIPSIIGASNFASRIISGFVAFSFRQHVTYICGGALLIGGVIILISVVYGADLFWFQILYAALFGLAPGFFSTLRAIIYVKYLGLANLTNAFGLIAMGMGTGIFLGTVVGGYVNDMTGGYTASFVISGACFTIAGILKLILPTLVWRYRKRVKV